MNRVSDVVKLVTSIRNFAHFAKLYRISFHFHKNGRSFIAHIRSYRDAHIEMEVRSIQLPNESMTNVFEKNSKFEFYITEHFICITEQFRPRLQTSNIFSPTKLIAWMFNE